MVKSKPNLKPSFILGVPKQGRRFDLGRDGGYKTKQRETVLAYLKDSGECLSADDIINGVGGNVSKTTVYRCLEHFVSDGSVSKFISGVGESSKYRYNGSHKEHFHLKCTECGSTACVDCGFITRMDEHFLNHHGFAVNRTQTTFYGLCRICGRKRAEAH